MKNLQNQKSMKAIISRFIFAFLFVSSWVVFGIAMAVSSVKVNIGGKITFTATNVYARITGEVSGTLTQNVLNPIEFDADTVEVPEHPEWSNMTLDFAGASGIVITVNITNLSTERSLIVGITDAFPTENISVAREMKKKAGDEFSSVSTFGTTPVETEETLTIKFYLTVDDMNKSVNSTFDMFINLCDSTPAEEDEIAYTLVDGKAQISAYTGSNETFVIPETINGCQTTLAEGTSSAGVTLPETTKTVVIPGNSIPYAVFRKNTTLENVIINDSVETIGGRAFFSCSSLKNITLPRGLKTIEDYAFYKCNSLTSIELPELLETISQGAFYQCPIENIIIPDSVKNIGMGAFYGCTSLKSVKLSNSLNSIGRLMFSYCSGLESITIPNSVESIGFGAFTSCTSLKNINFSNTLKSIDRAAFQNCSALKNIDLPDSVEFIGDYAFNHCSGIENTNIKIPNNIKQLGGQEYIELDSTNPDLDTQEEVDEARRAVMGTHIFYDCAIDYLTSFSLDSNNQNYTVVDGVLYTKDSAGNPEVLVAYPSKKVQPNNTYTMPNTVKDAYECAMSRTYNLDKIIISDSFIIKEVPFTANDLYALNGDWANNLLAMMYLFTSANIEVKSTNTRYYSENGAIYGKDGTDYANILFYMPIHSNLEGQTFAIKEGTTTIFNGAIPHNTTGTSISSPSGTIYKYAKIYIPASVTTIGEKSLNVMNGVKDYVGKISSYTIEIDLANTAFTVENGKIVTK